MKRVLVLLLSIASIFCSCVIENGNANQNPYEENKDQENDVCVITFDNNTDLDVNVYDSYSPYYMTKPSITVPAGSKITYTAQPSKSEAGTAFYFEYILKIGDYSFPYWPGDYYSTYTGEKTESASYGYKNVNLENQKTATIVIDKLQSTPTKSAFILVENNTTSDIYLKIGNSSFIPCNRDNKFIKTKTSEIYEVNNGINRENQPTFEFAVIENLKIRINENEINFPSDIKNIIQNGNIYTVSVNTDEHGISTASLKSVTPFNLDTQKKIWSKDESLFDADFNLKMKRSIDNKSTIIIGTPKKDYTYVGYQIVDEYGEFTTNEANFGQFGIENKKLDYSEIVDFIEMEDKSFFMLIEDVFEDESRNYILTNYNFSNKAKKDTLVFSGNLRFRKDSKNILVPLSNNRVAFVGAINASSDDELIRYKNYVCLVDYSDPANLVINQKISNEYDEMQVIYDEVKKTYKYIGTERLFSSAYFDGTDLYICGWENWSPSDYSTTHLGKIYKINVDSFENSELEETYSMENCLFFSIEGNGKDYAVCGEYTDSGKILKGCFITGNMIQSNSVLQPVLTTISKSSYCWFNQLCLYDNKIVLCGLGSSSFNGKENPLPFVVAYDKNGNKLWENLSYTKYIDALNILPNTIGTYLLQLKGCNEEIHYVNADLLGNEGR